MRRPTALESLRLPESPVRQLLVVDDYVSFAEALACRLDIEPGLTASAVTTIEQTRSALIERRFDVVLLDIELDGGDGIEFAGEALSAHPDMRIVVVTAGRDESRIIEAVQIGVSGWVLKDDPIEHLLSVVWGALRGETWIPPRLLTFVLTELKSAQSERAEQAARARHAEPPRETGSRLPGGRYERRRDRGSAVLVAQYYPDPRPQHAEKTPRSLGAGGGGLGPARGPVNPRFRPPRISGTCRARNLTSTQAPASGSPPDCAPSPRSVGRCCRYGSLPSSR